MEIQYVTYGVFMYCANSSTTILANKKPVEYERYLLFHIEEKLNVNSEYTPPNNIKFPDSNNTNKGRSFS